MTAIIIRNIDSFCPFVSIIVPKHS